MNRWVVIRGSGLDTIHQSRYTNHDSINFCPKLVSMVVYQADVAGANR